MRTWLILLGCMISFLSMMNYLAELREAVKRTICAVLSEIWLHRVRASTDFSSEKTILGQNHSVHQELNVRRCFENFECIAGFTVNAVAAAEVITIRKKLTRARRRSIVSRETRLCQGVVCLSEKNRKTGVLGVE